MIHTIPPASWARADGYTLSTDRSRIDIDAVERQCCPIVRRAADADVTGLSLVAFNRDTGKTPRRLRDVLVRKTASRVRRHNAH